METYAQFSIRHCIDMIAPFEMSDQQEDGQLQFYQFMLSLYREMYENPEEYMVFPKPYEDYMAKLKVRESKEKKEKQHSADSRESTLRNTFQQAIQFYALYLYRIGVASKGLDAGTGALVVRKGDYFDVIEQMNRIHEAKYNAGRYEKLSKRGIQVSENGDTVRIVHGEYPQMMQGISYLCKAPESKYKWMNFLRLDFKNAYSPIPSVEDICKTLSAGSVEAVNKLENNLSELKVKARIKPLGESSQISSGRWNMYIRGKTYAASMRIMNTSCCAFISTIFRISMGLQRFYMRKTTTCSNGLKSSSPRGCANVQTTGGFISVRSPGVRIIMRKQKSA